MQKDEAADHAVHLMESGSLGEAIEILEKLVKDDPDVDRYVYRLGCALMEAGQTERGLLLLKRAVVLHPQFSLFHHTYISALARTGDIVQARAAYDDLGGLGGLSRALAQHFVYAFMKLGVPIESLAEAAPQAFGAHFEAVTHAERTAGYGVVGIEMRPTGYRFHIPSEVRGSFYFIDRLVAFIGYFDHLWTYLQLQENPAPQFAWLSLDDLPPDNDEVLMCFSGERPNHILVPDATFLQSGGYRHMHRLLETKDRAFAEREPKGYWRGSLTGVAYDFPAAIGLPRVRLSSLHVPQIDAKITSCDQFKPLEPELSEELGRLGALGDRQSEEENFRYQILIDVDGNSNAWASLYLKLLAGGCVVKAMTPLRQWYYGKLDPFRNFVPTPSVEAMPAAVALMLSDPARAEAIGQAGRRLAQSLTVESEFSAFLEGWTAASRPYP